MHLSTTFLVFGLASVACAAPRAMNAKARNAGLDIDVFRPELDNRGIPVPVEGDTTLSGYKPLMPRQAGQDKPPEKKKGKEKKVKIQEPPSAVTVQKDPKEGWITFSAGGTPLTQPDRILFRIDFVQKFKAFMKVQKFPSFTVPKNIQIRYTLEGSSGAGGQRHKIVKFTFTQQTVCGAQPCRGFMNYSTGKFGINHSNGRTVYSVGPSRSQLAKLKSTNPSIPHPPAGYYGKPLSSGNYEEYRDD